MERLGVAQRSPKQSKTNKKKPIKVVYISNPMRVRTSESEFRAVVQKLTGQDSDVAENVEEHPTAPEVITKPEVEAREVQQAELYKGNDFTFEMLEQAFPLPVLDNIPVLMTPPLQFNDCLRSIFYG